MKKIHRKVNVSKKCLKTREKWAYVFFCTKTEAKFKKRSLSVSAAFDALSDKKKILGFLSHFGWTILEIRCKKHVLRKTQNKFLKEFFSHRQMIKPLFFYQNTHREKLYKTCRNQSPLTCSESVHHTQNEKHT
jgi:hypothetical protein